MNEEDASAKATALIQKRRATAKKAAKTRKARATAKKAVKTRKARGAARKAVQTRKKNKVRLAAEAALVAIDAGDSATARLQVQAILKLVPAKPRT